MLTTLDSIIRAVGLESVLRKAELPERQMSSLIHRMAAYYLAGYDDVTEAEDAQAYKTYLSNVKQLAN